MDIAFDIETIPNSAMLTRLPPIEVKAGNLKDPAKIAEKEAAAKAEQIAKMALNPLWGRICSVAIAADDHDWGFVIDDDSDKAETALLESTFEMMSKSEKIITYNGTNFDLRFLYCRAVILGVNPRQFGLPTLADFCAPNYGYSRRPIHADVMTIWCGRREMEKLDNLSRIIVADKKNEIDFRDFPDLIRTAEGRQKLHEYNMQDAKLTLALFNRIAGILA